MRNGNKIKFKWWGTYDAGNPRFQILTLGLQEVGAQLSFCHKDIWKKNEDKSQIKSIWKKITYIVRILFAYPKLIFSFIRENKCDAVIISYPGYLDVLVIWFFAKLTGKVIVWDMFISLYNTVVEDRALVSKKNPLAFFLWGVEWLSLRAADVILLDTNSHCKYIAKKYGLNLNKFGRVFVGATPNFFPPEAGSFPKNKECFTVLFYGTFIPLHGVQYIIEAAYLLREKNVKWVIVGKGQEASYVAKMLKEKNISNLVWIKWVNFEDLRRWICNADVCLGIFGTTLKSSLVIPNKVFQVCAVGKPVITRDSVAIRELFADSDDGISFVSPGDSKALADAVDKSIGKYANGVIYHQRIREEISPACLAMQLISTLRKYVK